MLIPDSWATVQGAVKAQCPSAVIAGGALRDLAFGGEVNDIDIFVPVDESNGHFVAPAEWVPWRAISACSYVMRDEVAGVEEFLVPGFPHKVQVIHLTYAPGLGFAHDAISRIDFDCCRAYARNGNWTFYSAAFADAMHYRRFKLVSCEDSTQARRSLRRAEKMQARYPNIPIDVSLAHAVLAQERVLEGVA